MRITALALVLAACGTEQGAYLTLSAPDGVPGAKSYELVLASPDEIPVIGSQRVTPTGTATESVTYYLQKTTVNAQGTLAGVDGFTILVEPNGAPGAYIPFLVVHDGAGAVVGMGTFRATDGGAPAPILVNVGEVDRYQLEVEPVTEVTTAMAVGASQAMRVDCFAQDQSRWPSGIVWRPGTGGELRLLYADPTTGGDATARKLDMDCDAHEVAPNDASADCDDTRSRFHAGAAEACDMEDTNCDDIRTITQPCTLSSSPCGATTGVALCDDATGTLGTACMPDATCACAISTGSTCTRCVLQHATASPPPGETVPCQPGIGQLSLQNLCDGGAPCIVQVLGTHGGWDAAVGANSTAFGPIATGVGSNIDLRVRRPEGANTAIPGAPGHTVGSVDLDVVSTDGTHHYVGVDLDMDEGDSVCAPASPYSMTCTP